MPNEVIKIYGDAAVTNSDHGTYDETGFAPTSMECESVSEKSEKKNGQGKYVQVAYFSFKKEVKINFLMLTSAFPDASSDTVDLAGEVITIANDPKLTGTYLIDSGGFSRSQGEWSSGSVNCTKYDGISTPAAATTS
jgi:hypothetical protein